jgi:catechol 2,3-dioxygenase-like lactoylglutathione lyase family enzyme
LRRAHAGRGPTWQESTCRKSAGSLVAARYPRRGGRARAFYRDKLGLTPAGERPGGLLYQSRGCEFELFRSAGQSPGTFTQMGWTGPDWDAEVAGLRSRGVVFGQYDFPGLTTEGGIAFTDGGYASRGARAARGAWFRDSEGNLLGLVQFVLPALAETESLRLRCTRNLLSRRTCCAWRMQATPSRPGSRCSPRSIKASGRSAPRLSAR